MGNKPHIYGCEKREKEEERERGRESGRERIEEREREREKKSLAAGWRGPGGRSWIAGVGGGSSAFVTGSGKIADEGEDFGWE
ncbi:hypothetical protein TIFTF001_029622 [Ficus carica]|uniref:Uncharacterized protein n=1 Tax=Ficus carica TaxID=3494 RepID=A0AA88DSP4_FICCA|nr:hypothetical protein TIFTF001_029622 [Ficus carica]